MNNRNNSNYQKNNRSSRPKHTTFGGGGNNSQRRPYGNGRSLPTTARPQRPEDFGKKWERLRDSYLLARRKFFDQYSRIENISQKEKWERDYYEALDQLRQFETFLQKNYKHIWNRFHTESRLDDEYSVLHPEDPFPSIEIPSPEKILEIHLTAMQQKGLCFQQDCEESEGTMDDYFVLRKEKEQE